jgi:required for meiotic nuclear division protein 1
MRLSAFYIAEGLQLKPLKAAYAGTILQENPSELFYQVDEDRYFYAFDYGAVVFANMSDVDMSQNLVFLQQFCENPLNEKLRDDFEIIHRPGSALDFGFDSLVTPRMDEAIAKIVMMNLAQSTSLDFYAQRGDRLLSEVHKITDQMEKQGRIDISKKEMIRFIGRSLNSQNRIVENLFIFDSPEVTWDDEMLDKIHRGLSRTFEIQSRFRETEYTFKVVAENLAVFRELYFHRESNTLEWIIIALICIEVFDLIVSKFF